MQKEVEMKCHITEENKDRIENFLHDNAENLGQVHKTDIYFADPQDDQKINFRIREESFVSAGICRGADLSRPDSENIEGECTENTQTKYIVTKKTQKISDQGLEINDELEFEVSSKKKFEQFCEAQNIPYMFTKTKKIKKFLYQNILIEWCDIDPIGEFLEIEIVTDEAGVEQAGKKIKKFFRDLNIENDIEKKPYFVLLGVAKK